MFPCARFIFTAKSSTFDNKNRTWTCIRFIGQGCCCIDLGFWNCCLLRWLLPYLQIVILDVQWEFDNCFKTGCPLKILHRCGSHSPFSLRIYQLNMVIFHSYVVQITKGMSKPSAMAIFAELYSPIEIGWLENPVGFPTKK